MLYHGEHGRLQGTQGTHKYLVFGARPYYTIYKELKAHTSIY